MDENVLKVKLTGEDANLTTSMANAIKGLDSFAASAEKAASSASVSFTKISNGFKGIAPQIGASKRVIDDFRNSLNFSARPMQSPIPAAFKKDAADASNALMNFGRIVQDSNYGLIGMANNFNPMLESFQRLQKETGSTSGALKSMLSGLSGPAGIGLALSAASSLAIAFGDSLFGAGEKAKYLKDDLQSLGKSADGIRGDIQSLSNDLQFLNSVSSLKISIAGGTDVDVLKRQADETELTINKILQARENLNRDLLTLTQREAQAKPSKSLFGDLSESDEQKQIKEAIEKTNQAIKDSFEEEDKLRRSQAIMRLQQKAAQKKLNEEEVKEAEELAKKLAAERRKDLAERKRELAELESIIKAKRAILSEEINVSGTIGVKNINFDADELKNAFDRIGTIKPITIMPRVNVAPDFIPPDPDLIIEGINQKEMAAKLEDVVNGMAKGLQVTAFTGLGEAIGDVLSGDGIDDALADLGEVLGGALKSLGQQMIALAPIMTALKAGLRALDPTQGLLSGVALVALGTALQNSLKVSLPGHRDGLNYVPYDDYVARLHKGEMVLTAQQANQIRQGARSDLDLSGGSGFIAQTVLKGDDLLLMISRATRRQRRGS